MLIKKRGDTIAGGYYMQLYTVYSEDLKCIRCNRKTKTLHHLWECDMETNKVVEFERIMKEWLHDRIHNMKIFKEVDTLLDNLYKYTRFAVTLKHLNTKENTEIYRRLNPFNKRLTYIWDETESMDNLVRGWIPHKLLDILKSAKSDFFSFDLCKSYRSYDVICQPYLT